MLCPGIPCIIITYHYFPRKIENVSTITVKMIKLFNNIWGEMIEKLVLRSTLNYHVRNLSSMSVCPSIIYVSNMTQNSFHAVTLSGRIISFLLLLHKVNNLLYRTLPSCMIMMLPCSAVVGVIITTTKVESDILAKWHQRKL